MAYVERVMCLQISCSTVADENLSVSRSIASMLSASCAGSALSATMSGGQRAVGCSSRGS
eukprot:5328468-Prymnesium_polylepis.1